MNVEKFRKQVEESLKADRAMKEVGKVLQEYDDQRQDLRIERAEIFQPITTHVEEVKKSIDDRQDEVLEKLTDNQNALALATAIVGTNTDSLSSSPSYRGLRITEIYRDTRYNPTEIQSGY